MSLLSLLPNTWKERLRCRAGAVTTLDRLKNLRRAGFSPARIIDAGAYHGDWARIARQAFPQASILMIEPQPDLESRLRQTTAELPKTSYRRALLGPCRGIALFVLSETNSRIVDASFRPGPGESVIELPIETLAAAAEAEGFLDAEFLKLDLQGRELDALAGAGRLFGGAEVIHTEVSWLRIGDVPLLHEVMAAFSARGYRAYDVSGFNYRPRDRALWQTDITFVREDSKLIESCSWS